MRIPRLGASVVAGFELTTGRGATVVYGTAHAIADVTLQCQAAWGCGIGSGQACVPGSELFDEITGQAVEDGLCPVERNAKGGAAGTTAAAVPAAHGNRAINWRLVRREPDTPAARVDQACAEKQKLAECRTPP